MTPEEAVLARQAAAEVRGLLLLMDEAIGRLTQIRDGMAHMVSEYSVAGEKPALTWDEWVQARGAVHSDDPAEVIIRRLRDEEWT